MIKNYNTQLQALLHLAEDRDIPEDYYRVVLALGIDYGSVVTIGDSEVDQEIRRYVLQIFDFIQEADEIIKQYDADWQAKDYLWKRISG